jgi:DNA polymerase III psi subunit
MNETRRRAYLEALGLDVWVQRPDAQSGSLLGTNQGRGSTLMVFPRASDMESELVRDLLRAAGGEPACAWLEPDPGAAGETLEELVAGRLITRILLFGGQPAKRLFAGAVPEVCGSSRLSVMPDLGTLARNGPAKKALWGALHDAAGGPDPDDR